MKRRGVSRTRAVISAIVIAALALASLGYFLATPGKVGCMGCGGTMGLVRVTGTVSAPDAYGVAQLTIEVNDTGSDPLWTIEVTNSSGLQGATFIAFYHNTVIVSAANALSVNQTAMGSTSVRNATAGATYTLGMEFVFSTGAKQYQTLQLTAGS